MRLLSLDEVTVQALRAWKEQQKSEKTFFDREYIKGDRVFTWEDGRDVHPDVIRQRFNRLSERCGLPPHPVLRPTPLLRDSGSQGRHQPQNREHSPGPCLVGFTLDVYRVRCQGWIVMRLTRSLNVRSGGGACSGSSCEQIREH